MGLFSRLFGGQNDGQPKKDKADAGEEPSMLRTVRNGGYDRTQTLLAIDALNRELMMLTEVKEARENGRIMAVPPRQTFNMPNKVNMGGLSEEDVEKYLASLTDKLEEMRRELGE